MLRFLGTFSKRYPECAAFKSKHKNEIGAARKDDADFEPCTARLLISCRPRSDRSRRSAPGPGSGSRPSRPAGKGIPKYERLWRAYFGGVGKRCRCRADGRRSVEKTEEPERDLVAAADLDIVVHYETVGDVRNLIEALALPADLEEILAVDKEITLFRVGDRMGLP